MKKLLETFRANPTDANRVKLQTYIDRHMMAICLASADDVAFLRANLFRI